MKSLLFAAAQQEPLRSSKVRLKALAVQIAHSGVWALTRPIHPPRSATAHVDSQMPDTFAAATGHCEDEHKSATTARAARGHSRGN